MIRNFTLVAIVALVGCKKEQPAEPPAAPPQAAAPAKPAPKLISITSKSPEAVAEFQKADEAADNMRLAEAETHVKKAIELDSGFAQAQALLGYLTPGADGMKMIEQAATGAAALPEAERSLIEAMKAMRGGEDAKAFELWSKVAALAPDDYRAHMAFGQYAMQMRKLDEAIAAFKKTVELNPKAGEALNGLGYALLQQEKYDEAAAAFRKYAELRPTEPNAHDSLADALLGAGKVGEAEAAYRKALEVSPAFWMSWQGVAGTRFLRADWAGGREALAKAREGASRMNDKLDLDFDLAWSQYLEGKKNDALKTLDAAEKEAEKLTGVGTYAMAALHRANMKREMGKAADGLKQATTALERAEKAGLPGGAAMMIRRYALVSKLFAEVGMKKVADAEKTLAALDEEVKKVASPFAQSALHLGQGEVAVGKGDAKAAAEHFGQCVLQYYYCRLQLVTALEKAGDKAGADAARAKIVGSHERGAEYLFVFNKLGGKVAPPAAEPAAAK